jgi:hypothetical protein
VRRYSSTDEAFKPDPATITVPPYWFRPLAPLSTAPGMHRFAWDMHYQPLDGGGRLGGSNLPIAAIGHNTVPAPTTPWVNPGTYTVKLTVNGKTYSQPIVVKQDPRVKTPALAMQQVYTLSKAAYYGALDAQDAAKQVRGVRDQIASQAAGVGMVAQALTDPTRSWRSKWRSPAEGVAETGRPAGPRFASGREVARRCHEPAARRRRASDRGAA